MRTNHLFLATVLMLTFCGLSLAAGQVRIVKTPNGGQVPDAAVDAAGTIHLAYVSGDDAYYVKSTDAAKTFSEPIRVNSKPGTAHPPHTFRGPDIAIGKDNQVHIIWYTNAYQKQRPKNEWGVYYARLDNTKKAFETARNLNGRPSDNYSIAADPTGNVAVVSMAGGLYLSLSRNGGKTFSKPVRTNADPCECCASRAHYTSKGALQIFYREKARNNRDMYMMVLSRSGRSGSTARISPQTWKINACPMTGAYLTGFDSKSILAAWETNGAINVARLLYTGRPVAPGKITAAKRGKYPVALPGPDDSFLAAWKSGQAIKWQVYDAKGKPKGQAESKQTGNKHRFAGATTKDGDWIIFE